MTTTFRRALALCLLVACVHGQPVPDGSDDSWIEPGHTYRGEVTGRDGAFDKTARFRLRASLGQRLTFRIRTIRTIGNSRGVSLVRPGEQFGPEVASIDHDAGKLTETVASVVPPEDGLWELSFTNLERDTDHWNYELDFLPAGDPVREVRVGQTVTGTLSDTDAIDVHGTRIDTWRLAAGERSRFHLVVKGEGFKALMKVHEEKPDGALAREGWGEEYEDLTASLSGDAFVEVFSDDENARGPYTLEVRDAVAEELAKMPVVDAGGSIEGLLAKKDGPRMLRYRLRGTPGRTYVLEVSAENFNPLAILLAPGNDHPQNVVVLDGSKEARLPEDGALVAAGPRGPPAGGAFVWPDLPELVLTLRSNDDDASGAIKVTFAEKK